MSTSINSHRVKAETLKIEVIDDVITIRWNDEDDSYSKVHLFFSEDGVARKALEQLLNQAIAGIVTLEILNK